MDQSKKPEIAIEKEKVVYEYKGEILTAEQLTGQVGIPCEAIETRVAEHKGRWGNVPAGVLPKLFMITGMNPAPYGEGTRYLTYSIYLKKWRTGGVYVPKEFKIKKLTGGQGKKMIEAYRDFQLDQNLGQSLQHSWAVGCIPEIFAEDDKGIVIPAFSFLAQKKEAVKTKQNCSVYNDSFVAEFDTEAGGCLSYLIDSVQAGLKTVYGEARKVNKEARLSIKNVMEIPYDTLQTTPDGNLSFGSKSNQNIYGLQAKDIAPRELPFRSASGHLHFGIGKKTPEQINEIIKALDAVLGVACVSLFASFDNPVRRQVQGMCGDHRVTKKGIEYRALSNAVFMHPAITNLVFALGRKVVMLGLNNFRYAWKADEQKVLNTVNNCDVNSAREILEGNKAIFVKLLKAAFPNCDSEPLYNIFMKGAETLIQEPNNFVSNWNLEEKWTMHCDGKFKSVVNSMEAIKAGKKI